MTAIFTAPAARDTAAGTASSCVAENCHSYGIPELAVGNKAGSLLGVRETRCST